MFGGPRRPLLDRSPSGTGSSAHLAYLYYKGIVKREEPVEFISAINTSFLGRIVNEVVVGGRRAIIPEISTRNKACYITGYSTAILELDDPLGEGFPPLPL